MFQITIQGYQNANSISLLIFQLDGTAVPFPAPDASWLSSVNSTFANIWKILSSLIVKIPLHQFY
jgi:hypothetical protein